MTLIRAATMTLLVLGMTGCMTGRSRMMTPAADAVASVTQPVAAASAECETLGCMP
jgi:hypothetical protein